jgi:hypothetical protein
MPARRSATEAKIIATGCVGAWRPSADRNRTARDSAIEWRPAGQRYRLDGRGGTSGLRNPGGLRLLALRNRFENENSLGQKAEGLMAQTVEGCSKQPRDEEDERRTGNLGCDPGYLLRVAGNADSRRPSAHCRACRPRRTSRQATVERSNRAERLWQIIPAPHLVGEVSPQEGHSAAG